MNETTDDKLIRLMDAVQVLMNQAYMHEQKTDFAIKELAEVRKDINDSKSFIENIMSEVKPLLDKLSSNSMFKMLLGGK